MGLLSRNTSEKEGYDSNTDTKCVSCGKFVNSFYDRLNQVTVTTELAYQEAQAVGMGMYCPNCDHAICIGCLPKIKKETGRTTVLSGLVNRFMSKVEIALDDIPSENIPSNMKDKIRAKLQTQGTKIVVMQCTVCEAFLGNLSKDKEKHMTELATKVTQDYDAITLGEVTATIGDLALFMSRLKQKNILGERLKQLTVVMEQTLICGFPILKKVILMHIERKEYEEAKSLCDRGTEWAEHAKDKDAWENDLNLIDTLINVSKAPKESPTKDDKIITLPPGVERKTIWVKSRSDNKKSD